MNSTPESNKKCVVILSGGIDSTVLLYHIRNAGYYVEAISFSYGQKHSRELHYAKKTCEELRVPHNTFFLDHLSPLFLGSSLTDDIEVPDGHYQAENMKSTVVPMRNAIFLSLACAYARSRGFTYVAYGAHAGDHEIYWDCKTRFLDTFNSLIFDQAANQTRGSLSPEWVRAFFEAEGCFTHTNHKAIHYHRQTRERIGMGKEKRLPICIFSQKDKALLEEIQKFFYGYGTISTQTSGRCYDYKLTGQSCRLVVDLFKGQFKNKYKQAQYNQWWAEFKDYLSEPFNICNSECKDRQYAVVSDGIEILAPFVTLKKEDIIKIGATLGVNFKNTYSCYKGREIHCGACGTCTERKEAFKLAGIEDPTEYE